MVVWVLFLFGWRELRNLFFSLLCVLVAGGVVRCRFGLGVVRNERHTWVCGARWSVFDWLAGTASQYTPFRFDGRTSSW